MDTEENFSLDSDFFYDEDQLENLWQERTGLDLETICGAIETIIFMSDRPISLLKIKNIIDENIPLKVLHQSIEKLQAQYELTSHGIRLVEVAEGYQFRTKAMYSKFVQDLFKVNSLVLSPSSLEVLAIIAYKQPISRMDIDNIRGVDSSHLVRSLMDKRLVKIVGRSTEVGKPSVYGTTIEFLEVFNLAEISDLPPEKELEEMSEQNVGDIKDIREIMSSTDNSRFFFDEMDELDKLKSSIKSISAETPFTKSLKVEDKKRIQEDGQDAKSAFDLLEDYVNKEIVTQENKHSELSELLMAAIDPRIIKNLDEGPFNTPIEEEPFDMIDVETGASVVEDDNQEFSEDLFEEKPSVGKIFEKLSDEDLTDALDKAFDKFDDTVFIEKENDIDEITSDMANKGEDLDLDLSFLKNSENSSLEDQNILQ